jgi:uncharacterized lipoprotein YmbA
MKKILILSLALLLGACASGQQQKAQDSLDFHPVMQFSRGDR